MKIAKTFLLILFLLGNSAIGYSQVPNLVPNGDFSNSTLAPWFTNSNDEYLFGANREILNPSTSYHHPYYQYGNIFVLPPVSLDVPENAFGRQFPYVENQYIGLISFRNENCRGDGEGSGGCSPNAYNGYVGVELTSPLTQGRKYFVNFHASRMENFDEDPNYEVIFADNMNNNTPAGNKITVKSGIITATHAPQDVQWDQIYTEFIADEPYKFLFIKMASGYTTITPWGGSKGMGLYIDDVSVKDVCYVNNLCEITADDPWVQGSTSHNNNAPFCIYGLYNATEVTLEIITLNGTTISTYHLLNPSDKICWNGRTSVNAIADDVTYTWRAHVKNDCGTKVFEGTFIKQGGNNYPPMVLNSVTKPPRQCCIFTSDLFLSNQILVQDKTLSGPLTYKMINSITAGNNVIVPVDNEVIFEAGNYIKLLPGFVSYSGSSFLAKIESCNYTVNYSIAINDQVDLSIESIDNLISEDILIFSESEIPTDHAGSSLLSSRKEVETINGDKSLVLGIYPNPAIETLNVMIEPTNEILKFTIINILSQQIEAQEKVVANSKLTSISTSNLIPGLYILKVASETEEWVYKFVKL